MKKIALLALVAPVFAGTPAPVVTVPAPAPAPAAPCCALEIGAGHNWASKDLIKHEEGEIKSVDTVGIDLTGVHSLTPHHALTFRIGAAQGDETMHTNDIDGIRDKEYLRTISIMPGYRYTTPVGEKTSVFAGVNVGAVNQRIRIKSTNSGYAMADSDSAWGFGATGEIGLSYEICPAASVFAAYQLSGNTARNNLHDMKNHRQIHNGVRTGVSIKF